MLGFMEKILFPSRIEELESENCSLKDELDSYKKECADLRKRLSGERVVGPYCDKCKNLVITQNPMCSPTKSCLLDCKCKDFEHI